MIPYIEGSGGVNLSLYRVRAVLEHFGVLIKKNIYLEGKLQKRSNDGYSRLLTKLAGIWSLTELITGLAQRLLYRKLSKWTRTWGSCIQVSKHQRIQARALLIMKREGRIILMVVIWVIL